MLKHASTGAAVLFLGLLAAASPAQGHEVSARALEISRGVERIGRVLERYRASPAVAPDPVTPSDHRRLLGAAEIELVVGNRQRSLDILMGRLMDPNFRALPEYVDTLLLAAELLEEDGEVPGAMSMSKTALEVGGDAKQMAEAGARWFRLARRFQHESGRLELYELWNRVGGLGAADEEMASQAAYEAAFALRARDRFDEAIRLLAKVPTDTRFGSRAAYLAASLFVSRGDLETAERWFSAIMTWPLPSLPEEHPQLAVEREVRDLAALSAGRLLYERRDLAEAEAAYRRIADDSPYRPEACYELAHLSFEQKKRRASVRYLQCVEDHGAPGQRYVEMRLMKASLLAHLARYQDALDAYTVAEKSFSEEERLVERALAGIHSPSEFLFSAMERSAVIRGREATPGPPTIFGESWTPEVDHAYRVDRAVTHAEEDIQSLVGQIDSLIERVEDPRSFPALQTRRQNLERLLVDVQHLIAHAASTPGAESSAEVLAGQERQIETLLVNVVQEEEGRRRAGLQELSSIRAELLGLSETADGLSQEIQSPSDRIAREALGQTLDALRHASKRARSGHLDTFWVKKEHSTDEIRRLALERDEVLAEFAGALRDLSEDE